MKTNTTLVSYHGNAQLKADFVKELEWHREQDKFLKGTYSEGSNGDFRGCAVGCSLHSLFRLGIEADYGDYSSHQLYETLLGLPEWLARLEDWIFENVPDDYARDWPIEFAKAINPGSDLTIARHRIFAYILEYETKFDRKKFPQVDKVVTDCAALHNRVIAGGSVTDKEWSVVWLEAESAVESAESEGSEAESAVWSAMSAVWSAAGSARSAAWSAAESATWSAVWSEAWPEAWSEAWPEAWSEAAKRIAIKTLEILQGSSLATEEDTSTTPLIGVGSKPAGDSE